MAEFAVHRFTHDELGQIEHALPPQLVMRALANMYVEAGPGHAFLKSLATIHAYSKAVVARGRLLDFHFAVTLRRPFGVLYRELQYHTPEEMAGMAAGQLAVAKTLATWYGLGHANFNRMPAPTTETAYAELQIAGVQEAVCSLPKDLDITTFTTRDVYLQTRLAAEDAVRTQGADALAPFVDFPLFPIGPTYPEAPA